MIDQIVRPDERSRLGMRFFQDRSIDVAQNLLGRTIVTKAQNQTERMGIIREVAAWQGAEDSSAPTIRYHPGIVGVSQRYGHFLLDIGTGYQGRPSCVTIIGLYTPEGFRNGPGKVTKHLGIDKDFDSMPIDTDALWIGGDKVESERIIQRLKQAPANCKGYFYFNDCLIT